MKYSTVLGFLYPFSMPKKKTKTLSSHTGTQRLSHILSKVGVFLDWHFECCEQNESICSNKSAFLNHNLNQLQPMTKLDRLQRIEQ